MFKTKGSKIYVYRREKTMLNDINTITIILAVALGIFFIINNISSRIFFF